MDDNCFKPRFEHPPGYSIFLYNENPNISSAQGRLAFVGDQMGV